MLNFYRFKSIGRKISLCVAFIIIFAMGVTGGVTYASISGNMKSTVHDDMLARAQDKANLLTTQIGCYKRFIQSAAQSDGVKSNIKELQMKQLSEYKSEYDFLNIGFSDTAGNVSFVDGNTEQLAYQNFLSSAQNEHKTAVSAPFTDDVIKKQVIMIATPVKSNDGTDIGAVVGVIDAGIVTRLTQNMTVGKTGYCFVLDENGTYVACKDKEKVSSQENIFKKSKNSAYTEQFKKIATDIVAGRIGYAEFTENGSRQCIAYAPVKDANWFLALRGPKCELFESADNMLKQVIFCTIIFIFLAIVCIMAISRILITKPLKRTVGMLEELSHGHLGVRLKENSNDEVGSMAKAMNLLADTLENDILGTLKRISSGDMTVNIKPKDNEDMITPQLINTITTVKEIISQTEELITAAQNGNLSKRCDKSRFLGSWKDLADSINGLMDNITAPINEVMHAVRQMAVNDYTNEVSEIYSGTFKELADDINNVRKRLLNLQDVMVRVSRGDMSRLAEFESIGALCEKDTLTPAVATMMRTINSLYDEVKHLAEESIEGHLTGARGNADKFEGQYREIVQGFNDTLDAVARPLNEVQTLLGSMAVNDFTKDVRGEYKGDYLKITQSIRILRENLISMQNIAVKISHGDISELENYRNMGKRSENDMLVPAFIAMMESIKLLIDEVTAIASAAAIGNLDVRCRPNKFNGEYVEIVMSINNLLDAVSRPFAAVTRVMTSISNAEFDVRIDGHYEGEFKVLVEAVNKTARDLKQIVSEISEIMLKVANGNLNIAHIEARNGDFSAIFESVNLIANSLNEVIGKINIAATEVDSGAVEVSRTSQELSRGAEVQANSVRELTSSIAVISERTDKNAKSAKEASLIAQEAKEDANRGDERMTEMLKSIEEISTASKEISKIVKVIDDIAFQTKILALNAAVEAARAGAEGKGFAVVASEVGNLAQKSAKAAEETTRLIERTISKVGKGQKIAVETAKSLSSIVNRADDVAMIVSGIAQSSAEQAAGISRIREGLEMVSNVVFSNLQASQQSAAASKQLSGQSRQLRGLIEMFNLRR